MRRALPVLFALLASSASAQSWSLLIPGQYHGGEAPAEPGPGWLALVERDGNWSLQATLILAEPVFDVLLDQTGETSGVRIATPAQDALALLRHPALRAGDVSQSGGDGEVLDQSGVALSLGAQHYQLARTDTGLLLRQGNTPMPLATLEPEDSATLRWAGDLDRDGRLDLLIEFSGDNRLARCAYLSSLSGRSGAPSLLACHEATGC
ncbi:MAG TPA: hypothetical protein VLC08_07330 [Chitinolyticbacter sp.]|nr:hypothetical protein [Chitinolyticbacter sp.]